MPRKFLGEKLLRDVDCIRPSSLTLTDEELNQLPVMPIFNEGSELSNQVKGLNRLSRRFGGTIKIKKRLESVPELFLHDFKKRPKRHGARRIKRFQPMPSLTEPIDEPIREPSHINKGCERTTKSIFVSNPTIMTMQVSSFDKKNVYMHKRGSRSTNEILFDEILESYCAEASNTSSTVLQDEIDRVVENVRRQKDRLLQSDFIEPTSIKSSISHKKSPSQTLIENLSSPEYSGTSASDRWSSSDDFSDFGSIDQVSTNDDGYITAADSIRSVTDTSQKKNPFLPTTPPKNTNNKLLVPVRLRHKLIEPTIMYLSDDNEENDDPQTMNLRKESLTGKLRQMTSFDDLTALQKKIDDIDI